MAEYDKKLYAELSPEEIQEIKKELGRVEGAIVLRLMSERASDMRRR